MWQKLFNSTFMNAAASFSEWFCCNIDEVKESRDLLCDTDYNVEAGYS